MPSQNVIRRVLFSGKRSILSQAVGYWDARYVDDESNPQLLLSRSNNNVLSAEFGSAGNAYIRNGALVLSGTTGNNATTPDTAALDITGDIDIRVKWKFHNWTSVTITGGEGGLMTKYRSTATTRSYGLYILASGRLRLRISTTGSDAPSTDSSVATSFTADEIGWVRVTREQSSGTVTFYTSTDGITWTQLGTTSVNSAGTAMYSSTQSVCIGAAENGTGNFVQGQCYYGEIRNGIGGTVAFSADFQSKADFTTSFTNDQSQVVTINKSATDASDPLWLKYDGTQYVYLPGVSLSTISTPDSAFVSLTSDMSMVVRVNLSTYTPASRGTFLAKYNDTGAQRSFTFGIETSGLIRCLISPDGTATANFFSTSAVPFSANQTGWLRADFDADNGAAGRTMRFYYSTESITDPSLVSWTQLGVDVVIATAAGIFDSTSPVFFGGLNDGAANVLEGKIYYGALYSGIFGTQVAKFDASLCAQTGYTDSLNSTVWTINRTTSGRKTCVVDRTLCLLGTDDYLTIPHNDILNPGLDNFTAIVAMRMWSDTADFRDVLSKYTGSAYVVETRATSTDGYGLLTDTAPVTVQGVAPSVTQGTARITGIIADRGGQLFYRLTNSTLSAGVSITTLLTVNPSGALQIGREGTSANYTNFEFFAAAIFKKALTAAELEKLRIEMSAL